MKTKNCLTCKKEFERKKRFNIKWWETAKYCSKECYFQSKIGKPGGMLGKKAWNKGIQIQTNTGKTHFKKGQSPWNKDKIGEYKLWPNGRIMPWVIGRNRVMPWMTGENNHNWRGGYSKNQHKGIEYDVWRMAVYQRDGFKCKISNKDCEGKIEAHHILGFTKFPELRYNINNGITLCHAHHPRKRAEETRLVPVFQGLISAIAN